MRVFRIRRRCGQGCSSGGTGSQDDGGFGNDGVYAMTTYNIHSGILQILNRITQTSLVNFFDCSCTVQLSY